METKLLMKQACSRRSLFNDRGPVFALSWARQIRVARRRHDIRDGPSAVLASREVKIIIKFAFVKVKTHITDRRDPVKLMTGNYYADTL